MTEVTLTASKDASMGKGIFDGVDRGWNGKDNHLQVGVAYNSIKKVRSVVKFNTSVLPSGITSVESAVLRLTHYATDDPHYSGSSTAQIKVARMTADWGEGTTDPGEGAFTTSLDWGWDNRYNKFTGGHNETVTQESSGFALDMDVVDIVRDWILNGYTNYGFMLRNMEEVLSGHAKCFWSDDAGTAGNRPELIINYTVNTAPNAPTDESPTGSEIVNTLTPTFSATLNDPDPVDYITNYYIAVYEDDGTPGSPVDGTTMWISGNTDVDGEPQSVSVVYGEVNPFGILTPLVSGQDYVWKMTVRDKGALPSFTGLHQFTVNAVPNTPTVVVTPTPLSAVPDNTPNISVTHSDPDPADTEMDGYTVIIESESSSGAGDWSSEWTTGDVDISGAPSATANVTSGAIAWGTSCRVKARTQDAQGAWSSYSAPVAFTIRQTAVPINLNPTADEITTTTPTLSGTRGSTDDTIVAFSLRVYSDDLGTTMLTETEYTTTTDGNSFSKVYAGSALSSATAYRWQAKVESTIGGYSEWSALQRFVTASTSSPQIDAPEGDNAYTLTPTVDFSRTAAFNRVDWEVYPESSTSGNLGTAHYLHGEEAQSSDTSYSTTYAGTALEWDTGYKIRAKVSSDGGSNWSDWTGLTWFKTDAANTPTLTSVAGDSADPAWITDSTPDFIVAGSGGDTIDEVNVRVWNATGTSIFYDPGMVNVSNGASVTWTYDGTALVPGTTYKWDAQYQNTSGPTGPWSNKKAFRLNGPPDIPTQLSPPAAHVFDSTDDKVFEAAFTDPDVSTFEDWPASWEVIVYNEDTEAEHDRMITNSNLNTGLNSKAWTEDAFVVGTNYSWTTKFKDSKSEWSPESSSQRFRVSTPPNATISSPLDEDTVTTVTPSISWTYSGGTQDRVTIDIWETDDAGVVLDFITSLGPFYGTGTSQNISAGHLLDTKYYDIVLTGWNTDGLIDPSPSTINIQVLLDAPDPIIGVEAIANEEKSCVGLTWDQMSTKVGHTFIAYRIYRRRANITDWDIVAEVPSIGTSFYTDWEAGNSIQYQYIVRAVTTKSGVGVEMESGSDADGGSQADTEINSNGWFFIGADRADEHIYELTVTDESHNRPIQQEVFETLGASRKVIMRGFVLGHEGSITTLWVNTDIQAPEDEQVTINETWQGRRIVDYLTRNAGPHLVKSPFGDVWDSQFTSPEYQWLSTGHLEVTLEYVETGTTSETSF